MTKTLVLFAHPALHRSNVNVALADQAQQTDSVTFRDLYRHYPDFLIDKNIEQELLLRHDHIIFQHPLYWYSTPAILKEWLDIVLEAGFAYGEGGDKLHGKTWAHALSAGGSENAYSPGGTNRFTIQQFLTPLEQSAILCGMNFVAPFIVYDAHQQSQYIKSICENYSNWLRQFSTPRSLL